MNIREIKEEKIRPKPVVLCILDGWGVSNDSVGNAIEAADTPNLDRFRAEFPFTTLGAAGEAVGLPEGQMGNSEVGHLNLGAGRVVYQEITRINKAIRDGEFFENQALIAAMDSAKDNNKAVHLLGLLSDGGVHSHITHLYALINLAKIRGVTKLFVHSFLDGRDVPPQSAITYFEQLQAFMDNEGLGKVATVIGRYYAMDRDNRWERVQRAYDAMVYAHGHTAPDAISAVEQSYSAGVVDEFVEPTIIVNEPDAIPLATISDDDTVIFFNFRADRAREITRAFIEIDFNSFERGDHPPRVHYICMTQYDVGFKVAVAFKPQNLNNTLSDILSLQNLRQLHTAETEKYAHVTFFFNGGIEDPKRGEDRVLVPSPKVPTYDLKPEMSAFAVRDVVVSAVISGQYDFIVVNFANGDMVGHTGVFEAAVKAASVVDECVGDIVNSVFDNNGVALITADHGNADKMLDFIHNQPFTAHTTNEVPLFALIDGEFSLRSGGILADIAPTVLDIMNMQKPEEMTGISLIQY